VGSSTRRWPYSGQRVGGLGGNIRPTDRYTNSTCGARLGGRVRSASAAKKKVQHALATDPSPSIHPSFSRSASRSRPKQSKTKHHMSLWLRLGDLRPKPVRQKPTPFCPLQPHPIGGARTGRDAMPDGEMGREPILPSPDLAPQMGSAARAGAGPSSGRAGMVGMGRGLCVCVVRLRAWEGGARGLQALCMGLELAFVSSRSLGCL